jgi:hypothetical protein
MIRKTPPATRRGTHPPRETLTTFAPKNARSIARKLAATLPARHADQRQQRRAIT